MEGALNIYFEFYMMFILITIASFITITVLNSFPAGYAHDLVYNLETWIFSFINGTFLFLFLCFLVIESMDSYAHPSLSFAVLDVIGIFALGWLSYVSNSFVAQLVTFNLTTGTSGIASLFTSNTIAVLTFFFLIINVILNVQSRNSQPQPYEMDMSDYEREMSR